MDRNAETAETKVQGWTVKRSGVSWAALREEPLTDWQERYGCRMRVQATTPQELRVLCVAENVIAEMISAAERLVVAMAEQGRQWRAATDQAAGSAPLGPSVIVPRLSRERVGRDATPELDMPESRDEWRAGW
jgi:hypothetical protein